MFDKSLKVAIAISSYKSNPLAATLVRRITAEKWHFAFVLVVDSMGGEEFEQLISGNDPLNRVCYFNSETNLGSAGNLNKRLQWANELGMDYVLALNHDAEITSAVYYALLERADSRLRIGALYPLRFLQGKRIYDLTGKKLFPMTASGASTKPVEELIEVAWSSSNGALYSMAPLRGSIQVCPDTSLWMGWEDYLYGLQLRRAGYGQWIVSSAETVDSYEYKSATFSSTGGVIADKPMWYGYYDARNLILIALHRLKSPMLCLFVLFRVLLALLAVPLKYKHSETKAASVCLAGALDGIKNVGGKWKLP